MSEHYCFTVSKKYDGSNIQNFDNVDLDFLNTLKTKLSKKDSPLWSMSRIEKSRSNLPTHLSGMIVDYDSKSKPMLTTSLTYYTHQTHNNKWRVIVPFKKLYQFTTPTDFRSNYFDLLNKLFENSEKSVDDLINDKIIDLKCANANSWFHLRPHDKKLIYHQGNYFCPHFKKQSKEKLKDELISLREPKNIEKNIKLGAALLLKINAFMQTYQFSLKWYFLRTNKRCVFDWHDNHGGDCYFNEPNDTYPANIHCMHDTCLEKLYDFMKPYQLELIDDSKEKNPFELMIKDSTVLYLTAGLIRGIWSLDQIEACGLHSQERMLFNIRLLNYLHFDPKLDAQIWHKIAHDSLVMHPQSLIIHNYEDGYYKQIASDDKSQKEILSATYDRSLGTYVKYKRTNLPIKKYIDTLVYHSRGIMMENFKRVKEVEGLSLKNGILLFNNDGSFEFTANSPSFYITSKADFNYDSKADCPLWKKTLCDYFGSLESAQVKTLQEYFGYCLTYDRSFEKLLFLFGESRGGKNTVVQTLLSILPSAESSMDYLSREDKRGPSIIDKKVVFINEALKLNNQRTVNELKKMSSTDSVQIRMLYVNPFTTEKVPKLIITFDEMPDELRIDKALYNRMVAVKFTKSFLGKENKNLKKQLLEEKSGILNWMIEGYQRIYSTKTFSEYSVDKSALYNVANEEQLDLIDFISHCAKSEAEWKVSDLYYKYSEEIGETTFSLASFGKLLRKIGYKKLRKGDGIYYDIRGNK